MGFAIMQWSSAQMLSFTSSAMVWENNPSPSTYSGQLTILNKEKNMGLLNGMRRLVGSFGLGKKRKKMGPGKNSPVPADIAKLPELNPELADTYFTYFEPSPGAWLKLNQHGLSGWRIKEGKNTLSIDGPLRVRVKSVVMKSALIDHLTEYGYGPIHERIKKLAEEDPTKAWWGPEYELELPDLDNKVVRYFVFSPSAKAALSGALWVGQETILGYKVDEFRSKGHKKKYLVPVAWEPGK
jgi:hypothetical protein